METSIPEDLTGLSDEELSALADSLGSELVERRRRFEMNGHETRHLCRRREAVIRKVARERVAVVVVDDLLEQCLADSLDEAPVHLTFCK